MDTSPITARSLQKPYHIKGDEFERAYKDYLSDFRIWKHLPHARSWLVFPRNIGPNMSLDETVLSDGELYTILSNKDAHGKKGAMAAIIKGTKVEDVAKAIKRIPWYERAKVCEITMDFSESMHAIAKQCFSYADITIDRFHVQKDCYEALQQIRIAHRREAQQEEIEARERYKNMKRQNLKRRKTGKKDPRGRKPYRLNKKYEPKRLPNGDTKSELLVRSYYLLMVSADKWTPSQKTRSKLLFELYPDIKTAYGLCHSLRMIFSNRNATKRSGKQSLKQWYANVSEFDNANFNTVSATIYEREDEILNYFIRRATNASAESLNAKIKNFRSQLHGVSDIDFFLYRLSNIFG